MNRKERVRSFTWECVEVLKVRLQSIEDALADVAKGLTVASEVSCPQTANPLEGFAERVDLLIGEVRDIAIDLKAAETRLQELLS